MKNTVKPTLSICIPTYNRAAFLRESLISVFAAIDGMEDQVEVLVSDNASTDDTPAVVAEFKLLHPRLRFNRNLQNVIDKNYFIAASLAQGNYVWIFADDDIMEKNAIGRVLDEISRGYNLLILNYSIWDKNILVKMAEKFYNISTDRQFKDHNELLMYFSIKIQFLSSVVVKKDILFTLPEREYEKFYDYGFSFLIAILGGVKGGLNALLIADTLIKYRGNNSDMGAISVWYPDKVRWLKKAASNSLENKAISIWYYKFATGTTLVLQKARDYGYSAWAIYCAKHQVLKSYIFKNISYNRRAGNSMTGVFRLILPYYAFHGYFWFIIVPILFAPAPALRALHFLLRKCR